jgi:hypothetical protein
MDEVWVDVRRSDNRKCITAQKAFALQKSLDISELAATLTSETVKKLEGEGWRYCKVLKEIGLKNTKTDVISVCRNSETPIFCSDEKYRNERRDSKYEYMVIPIEKNRYGDCVLYSRLRETQAREVVSR